MMATSNDGAEGYVYSGGLGIRHLQVMVIALSACVAYLLRANLSVAIVAMADTKEPEQLAQTYDWDEITQGYVLSSFFWGYLVTQVPAGVLTEKFGGHRFLALSILVPSLLTIAFPQSVYWGGWQLGCANRMLQGMFQGFGVPAAYTLLGVWVPPAERSRLSSMALSSNLLGTVIAAPVSGWLSSEYGWPSVFYVLGGVGVGCSIIIACLGSNYPSTHRMISIHERHYIERSLGGAKEKAVVPWKSIAKSVPYYTASCSYIVKTAIYTTFITKVPTFVSTVLKFDLEESGMISALPFLASWISAFFLSWICDSLIRRGCLKITPARKLFNSIAFFGASAFVILLGHSNDRIWSVVFLTMTVACTSGSYTGVQASYVDLAPNFSGPIYGVANFVASCLGLCGPIIVGVIVTESGSAQQWRTVFYLFAILWVSSNLVFVIWGSSKTQWWNWPERYKDEEDYKQKREKEEMDKKSAC